VGYRETVAMLEGRLAKEDLREAIVRSTRAYAKRQETWFRNQLRHRSPVVGPSEEVWALDATKQPEQLAETILDRWRAAEHR
jgi:tRNA A37 N6-isopentenylltransferase MiaA